MTTELVELLRQDDARPCEVYEAHVLDGEFGQVFRTSVDAIVRNWGHCFDRERALSFISTHLRHGRVVVCVVHESGACLRAIPAEVLA